MNIWKQQETEEDKLPQLIKKSDTYKLFVPAKVEEKIRYLIRKYPSTEWSGVLFYSHTGGFETGDLEIHCEDIFPMDLGTAGHTEFYMSEDVTAYMAENPELFEYELGLIHSHHGLGAFFSGEDTGTLRAQGNEMNCFVSLVVDTRGTYVAAITRKVESKSEITVKPLGASYEFFGNGPVVLTASGDSTKTVNADKTVIECFSLDVQREVVENPLESLDLRFEEIVSKKRLSETRTKKFWDFDESPATGQKASSIFDDKTVNEIIKDATPKTEEKPSKRKQKYVIEELKPARQPKQGELFDEDNLDIWQPNPELIKRTVSRMLLLSLGARVDGVDIESWIKTSMNDVYERIFPDSKGDEKLSFTSFDLWCDFIVEFTVESYDDSTMPESIMQDTYYWQSIVATSMRDFLLPYENTNKYVKAYLEKLEAYIDF